MRHKREAVLPFAGKDAEPPKTVREYRARFKGISLALDRMPELLPEPNSFAVLSLFGLLSVGPATDRRQSSPARRT